VAEMIGGKLLGVKEPVSQEGEKKKRKKIAVRKNSVYAVGWDKSRRGRDVRERIRCSRKKGRGGRGRKGDVNIGSTVSTMCNGETRME